MSSPLFLAFFHSLTGASMHELQKKSLNVIAFRLTSVTAGGFEPPTLGAEIRYSIQLNYAAE